MINNRRIETHSQTSAYGFLFRKLRRNTMRFSAGLRTSVGIYCTWEQRRWVGRKSWRNIKMKFWIFQNNEGWPWMRKTNKNFFSPKKNVILQIFTERVYAFYFQILTVWYRQKFVVFWWGREEILFSYFSAHINVYISFLFPE